MGLGMFNIRVLGDKELDRELAMLPAEVQKRTVASALRKSAERLQAASVQKLTGFPVEMQTGRLMSFEIVVLFR